MVDLVGGDIIFVILYTGTFEIVMDRVQAWFRVTPVDQVFVCKKAYYDSHQH